MRSAAKQLGRALESPRSFAHAQDDRPGARGFTLIELLVALAVLVIGVYGMLRVFPPGYGAIEAGQQQTTAAQLADAEIARWRLDPEALPDAIIATDYQGVVIPATLTNNTNPDNLRRLLVFGKTSAVSAGSTDYLQFALSPAQLIGLDQLARPLIYSPTDLTPSEFDGAQAVPVAGEAKRPSFLHPSWQPNSLYLPRTVVGERIDIRSLPQSAQAGVPFYLLSHAPLDVLRYEPDTGGAPGAPPRAVYCDVYDARPWRQMPYPGPLRAREFNYNPATKALFFGPSLGAPTYPRQFKVDYTDLVTHQRVMGYTVAVTTGTGAGSLPDTASPDPSSIQVHERMLPAEQQDLANPQSWRRNRYYVDAETTVSGRIQFSPALHSDPLPTDITLAKADYRVADWQILVFDVEVPSTGVVELPVRKLKSAGYRNPPRQPRAKEIARGVRRFYNASGVPTDAAGTELAQVNWAAWVNDPRSFAYVVAVDRQSGDILTDNETLEWPTNPWTRRARFRVDYREGLLYFNYESDLAAGKIYGYHPAIDTPNRSGRTYRVFCRAEEDWAVQLSLAPRQYARAAPQAGYPDGLPGGPPSVSSPASVQTYVWKRPEPGKDNDPKQLFFPLSDAGQSVAVDYYWHDPVSGDDIFVSNEIHAISGPRMVNMGTVASPQPEWVCMLTEGLSHEPNAWGPTGVRGISVRARTTWVTSGRSPTLQDLVQGAYLGRAAGSSLQEAWHQVMITTYLTRAPI